MNNTENLVSRLGSRATVSFCGVLTAAGVVVSGATVVGLTGKLWWVADLFSHFQVQYLISLSVIILLLSIARRFRTAASLGACALLNLAHILPYYVPMKHSLPGASSHLRFLSVNVNTANQRYDLVERLIVDNNPDVVLLTEASPLWLESLAGVEALYPYRKSYPREDNFGIALYSKLSFDSAEIRYVGGVGVPSVVARLRIQNDPGQRSGAGEDQGVTVVGTHPLPPIDDITW